MNFIAQPALRTNKATTATIGRIYNYNGTKNTTPSKLSAPTIRRGRAKGKNYQGCDPSVGGIAFGGADH